MSFAASRLSVVQPSASAAVSQKAKALKAAGQDVIDLGLGEPDFDTPAHIIEAAHDAALGGQTRYPPTDGTAALKAAICAKFSRENGLTFDPSEVLVGNGAKQVIFDALMATLEPGDEVLLCAPYFGQYKDMVLVLGGTPVVLRCPSETGFRVLPGQLEAAITPKTRWIILNHPSNPAGSIYTDAELRALGRVLQHHGHVLVMSDEIYEHILFDGAVFSSFVAANPELRDRTLTVNGVSKAYAMTGWRIGYGAGPQALIKAMTIVQSQISSGACSVAQAAAAAALDGPQEDVSRFRAAFESRRDLVVARVADIDRLSLDPPEGAFYALIGCSGCIGMFTPQGQKLDTDIDVTQYLLEHALVAAVPGSAYDLSPFFRISTASSEATLNEALTRIATAVADLKPSNQIEYRP